MHYPPAVAADARHAGPLLTAADLAFLDTARVARLATSDAAGRPFVVPVCFACLGGRLYVPVDAKPKRGDPRQLRRLRNLRQQPEAVLLVDRYDEDWDRLRWLMVRAHATILEASPVSASTQAKANHAHDGAGQAATERARALAALEARYRQYAAMRLSDLRLPVIALAPIAVSRWAAAGSGPPPEQT
jgi:PPOX class probable F420-dependent enzyme